MSTLDTLNNGETGLIHRTKLNDNFIALNADKLESTDVADFETTTELNARDTANRDTDNHTDGVTNGVFTKAERAAIVLNTAKVTNVDHPLVETAVPLGALFTDTVYDDTAIQGEVDLNTAKVGITPTQASNITTNNAKITYPSADSTKLAGIESNATADQTGAEIKVAYEGETNTNGYTDAEKSKLAGLDSSHYLGTYTSLSALNIAHPTASAGDYANVDAGVGTDVVRYIWDNDDSAFIAGGGGTSMTDAEVKTAYENNADTNALTDTLAANIVTNNAKVTYPSADSSKLAGIEALAEVNTLNDVVAGTNITIDKTDSLNPIINSTVSGGSSTFSALTDTPASMVGQAGLFPKVNVGETALEYVAIGGGGDMLASTYDPNTVSGDTFDMDNMVEGATTKILTNTERTAIATNSAKVGITPTQASDITANNAKVGITPTQASNITTNNAKVSYPGDQDLSGLMVKSSNLSDLTNTTTARTNLGVDVAGTDNSTDVTVTDSAEINLTITEQDLTASLIASSIDETKLDTSVNASLDLADSAIQVNDVIVAPDHLTASTDQVVNVCYGTSATPPTASTTTEGSIYFQYTA